ncbi:hypothetical protein [Prescottella equi]|uniref:hypothetical protein n=1 Tax=Rhodococcus hoagii TaxID=43767 RepID=UPI00111C7FFF|nr:hypothetical protein [Prescottella equi]
MTGETSGPAATPVEWATAAEIPEGTVFESCEDSGRWIKESAGYRYLGALWTDDDIADHAPFTATES